MRQTPKGNRQLVRRGVFLKTLAKKEASVSVRPLKKTRRRTRRPRNIAREA